MLGLSTRKDFLLHFAEGRGAGSWRRGTPLFLSPSVPSCEIRPLRILCIMHVTVDLSNSNFVNEQDDESGVERDEEETFD
jgi:hypothetical protein